MKSHKLDSWSKVNILISVPTRTVGLAINISRNEMGGLKCVVDRVSQHLVQDTVALGVYISK